MGRERRSERNGANEGTAWKDGGRGRGMDGRGIRVEKGEYREGRVGNDGRGKGREK